METRIRHGGHLQRRRLVWDALCRLHTRSATLERYKYCGSAAYIRRCKETGDYDLVSNTCGSRWCPACAAARGAIIARSITAVIADGDCRFATLTLRHNSLPLRDQLDRLYRCASDLRRRKWWRDHVRGGAAVCEIKIGRDGRWHVHLHMLLVGRYIPQRELSQEWLRVTGDSSIVDVRAIRDPAVIGSYLAKYIAKPASSGVIGDPDRLDEMITALKGRRLCMTFGSLRGTPLEPTETPAGTWQIIGSVEQLTARARAGDVDALRACEAVGRRVPLITLLAHHPPSEIPP